jgi:Caspase domain
VAELGLFRELGMWRKHESRVSICFSLGLLGAMIFAGSSPVAQTPSVASARLETITDDSTGVKLAIPTALVGKPTTKQWGRNWRSDRLEIDTINWGNDKTLEAWYAELQKRRNKDITDAYISSDRFKVKGSANDYSFHVEGRSGDGQVRGVSVVWTRGALAPVAEAVIASFDAFPKRIIAQPKPSDRKELEEREKQIAKLNEEIEERDRQIKELRDKAIRLEQQVLGKTQIEDAVRTIRTERDELRKQREILLQEKLQWKNDRIALETENLTLNQRIEILENEIKVLKGSAPVGDRVALVIGINKYPNLSGTAQLLLAENDARAIGDALEKLGYAVVRAHKYDRLSLLASFDDFLRRIKPNDMAVVFFSGHGMGIAGANFLLPADVQLADSPASIRRMGIPEADMIADVQAQRPRAAVFILDACRDNPYKQPGLKSIVPQKGMALPSVSPVGLFSIYSAGLNQAALERLGPKDAHPNSIFTRVFLQNMSRPETLNNIMLDVRDEVYQLADSVSHAQTPAFYDQVVGGRICLVPGACPRPVSQVRDPAGPGPIKQ